MEARISELAQLDHAALISQLLKLEYPNVAPTDIASSVEQHFQTDHKKRKATSSPPALHTVSQSGSVPIDSASASKPASKAPRTFAWNKYHQRHIALHFAYIGAEYTGLAAGNLSIAEQEIDQFIEHKQLPPGGANPSASRPQPNWSERAVEVQVLYALKKCRLLRTIGEAQYQRCGRTDKGVSAMGQVVTLNVRTNLTAGVGVLPPFESADPAAQIAPVTDESKEFDYITLINRMLPDDIQVLGWAPMEPTFDARFSCTYRQYKYFFFGDNMDIGRMQQAANALIGRHDFRNFARLDTANLTENTVRVLSAFRIESADRAFDDTANLRDLQDGSHFRVSALGRFLVNKDVDADQISQNDGNWNFPTMEVCSSSSESTTSTRGPLSSMPGDQLFVMTITGQAFLWHQVRCMAAILMLVGSGQEDVSIVQRLLDIEATPRKPVYNLASDVPLVLYRCGFQPEVPWRRSNHETHQNIFRLFHAEHRKRCVESALNLLYAQAAASIFATPLAVSCAANCSTVAMFEPTPSPQLSGALYRRVAHVPLVQRETEKTLEERIQCLSGTKRDRYDERQRKTQARLSETAAAENADS